MSLSYETDTILQIPLEFCICTFLTQGVTFHTRPGLANYNVLTKSRERT